MQPQILNPPGLTMIAFPPAGLGVVIPSNPITAETLFRGHPDVVVAIDGPMFDYCPGQPRDYDRYQCGVVRYSMFDAGRNVNAPGYSSTANEGVTFSLRGGALSAASGRRPAPGASVAIQMYPGLVENGAIAIRRRTEGPDAQPNWRVAMGLLRDGRAFFAHGRKTMYEFAEALLAAGAVWAGYTDGGGSASLVLRRADGGLAGSDPDDPRGRRVPSWIVWSPTTSTGAPVAPQGGSQGASPLAILAGFSLAAAGVYVALRARRRRA